jgi:hypothetical protein
MEESRKKLESVEEIRKKSEGNECEKVENDKGLIFISTCLSKQISILWGGWLTIVNYSISWHRRHSCRRRIYKNAGWSGSSPVSTAGN